MIEPNSNLSFVKIISLKNSNFDLALRKRLFCNVKHTLLPCKRAAFRMQNNRFCNALIAKRLRNSCACEKCLHFSCSSLLHSCHQRGYVLGVASVMIHAPTV